jgi:hypothetical protein
VSKAVTYFLGETMDISTAAGDKLDEIGNLWGLKRFSYEDDSLFRNRVISYATGHSEVTSVGGWDPNTVEYNPLVEKSKCECGAASIGYSQPGPGHADWCPISSKQ